MHTSIDKWGNSLGVRIPSLLAKKLGIKVGTCIEVDIIDDKLIISKKEETETLEMLLNGITKDNINVDYLKDEAKGNEVW